MRLKSSMRLQSPMRLKQSTMRLKQAPMRLKTISDEIKNNLSVKVTHLLYESNNLNFMRLNFVNHLR